jgi:hypothetical protein
MTSDDVFLDELEIHRKDTEAATPFFYAYVSIRGVADAWLRIHCSPRSTND